MGIILAVDALSGKTFYNDYFETGVNSIAFNEDIAQGGKITVIVFNW